MPGLELVIGENSITVTATAPDGTTTTQILSVNRTQQTSLPPDPATVAPPLDRSVATLLYGATSFLYSGPNPIQTGVALGSIEPRRAAVLRGKLLDRSAVAVSGAKIHILRHPEFGQTLSRADGAFDLAVNGGGTITILYEKSGYLPVQRQINTSWQEYAWAPDVVMTALDPSVTPIDLTRKEPFIVARGSVMADADGARQATILFPRGTSANLILPDGSSQPISSLNVRATEYTVGERGPPAMPTPLPPTSAYTYCVELSADEAIAANAKDIQFDRPVSLFVENFLGFPSGGIVPLGYYDRDKCTWIASQNGRVISVLAINNSLADLDVTGSGSVSDSAALAAIGITDDERAELAKLYQPGQSLWRAAVTHFTPWDCNWPYAPPLDAKEPEQPEPKEEDEDKKDEPCEKSGSIIEIQNQVLGQRVPLSGLPFTLNYRSDRVPGRTSPLDIKLTPVGVPGSVKAVELDITYGGRRIILSFPPTPNQSYQFVPDGFDAYGRQLNGTQIVRIRIGYRYDMTYVTPAEFEVAFARISRLQTSAIARGRLPITFYQDLSAKVGANGRWDIAAALELGGWSLDVHHSYDLGANILYQGDGTRRTASSINAEIVTLAGGAAAEFAGDNGPAENASFVAPTRCTVDSVGNVYISDSANHRVRRISVDGTITTVAGNGTAGFSGDFGLATEASLNYPMGLAVDGGGNLFIAERNGARVRMVSANGIISTVAGNGTPGFSGDEGPANAAQLSGPWGIALDSQCNLYIADTFNNRIRKVGADGIITTVAGSGFFGYFSDNIPATSIGASLSWPTDVAVHSDGTIYIADYHSNRIRKVSPNGKIFTVVNNFAPFGTSGGGEGRAAMRTTIREAEVIALDKRGNLFLIDKSEGVDRIRVVNRAGIISTIAGSKIFPYEVPNDARELATAKSLGTLTG